MGLDFSVTAPIPKVGRKRLGRAALFDLVRKGVEASCEDPFLARFIEFGEHEHELGVVLHPGAESVFFTFDPSGHVHAAAKTSTTGPGYHAYATGVVRAVGRHAGLSWEWSDHETGFATSGDFARLQTSMAEFLPLLAATFLEHHKGGTMAVTMDMGYPVPVDGPFTITPSGPRDRSFWQSLRDRQHLNSAAEDFYIWWDRERNAAYYRKLGTMLLWTEIPWRPPTDEREERTCELALECFDRAAELDPQTPLPAQVARALQELRVYLDTEPDEPIPLPDPDGIGYRRQLCRRRLPGDWTIHLPGYWFETFDEEEGTLSIFHNELAVYATAFSLVATKDGPAPNAEQVCRMHDKHRPKDSPAIAFREGPRHALAWVAPAEEDGHQGFALQGTVALPGEALDLTIWFENPDDQDWAVRTFKSVSCTERPAR